MSTKPRKKDRRGPRRGGPRRSHRTKPPCAVCEEPIKDIATALARSADGAAVHFDCALKSAEEELNPEEGEKVIYLGKGSFGVVDQSAYRQRKLKIVRRSNWENTEEVSDWRKNLITELR